MTKQGTQGALEAATPELGDAEALRRRIRTDGYMFLPGLLDRAKVLDVRRQVLEALAPLGWLAAGSAPADALPAAAVRRAGDEAWWDGYVAIQRLEDWHALAHEPALVGVMRALAGGDVLVMPMKIARVTFPSSEHPTPPHQDHYYVRGGADVVTAWVPLGDCPPELGGLEVLAGSHRRGLRTVHQSQGVGGSEADLAEGEAAGPWLGASYRAGDVLMFHSLLVHRAQPNRGGLLRLSADYRYQAADEPLHPGVLFAHGFGSGRVPGWHALTSGWSTKRWIEAPEWVRLAPWSAPSEVPPPSRMLA